MMWIARYLEELAEQTDVIAENKELRDALQNLYWTVFENTMKRVRQ